MEAIGGNTDICVTSNNLQLVFSFLQVVIKTR